MDALLQAMSCLAPIDALAAIESALHLGRLSGEGLDRLLDLAPDRMTPTLERLNLGAQSGLETHARILLQDAGHEVLTQVEIGGAGILDLLVDDCVGVETDGEKWHRDRFREDRSKDVGVELWGIRVLRIGAHHLFREWPTTLRALERMIADARRGRSSVHGSLRRARELP
jgi:very-short-patch-repair endonuclease